MVYTWEALVGLIGLGLLLAGLFGNGIVKGMLAAVFSFSICLVLMLNTMPSFFQVVFLVWPKWRADGRISQTRTHELCHRR